MRPYSTNFLQCLLEREFWGPRGLFHWEKWMRSALPMVHNINILFFHGTFQVIYCFDIVLFEAHNNIVKVCRLDIQLSQGRLKWFAQVLPRIALTDVIHGSYLIKPGPRTPHNHANSLPLWEELYSHTSILLNPLFLRSFMTVEKSI